MTNQIETDSFLQEITAKRFTLLFLLGLSLFIVFARFHTYDEPVEHDITTASVIANEMRNGRRYYSEVWENKPPAVHIANVIAQNLFGYNRVSIYALNVSLSIITLLGVYAAASGSGMGPTAGLWAAVFWTLLSGDIDLQANQPNLEAFMNGPIVWAFALMLRTRSGNRSWKSYVLWSVGIGALIALASFYKPQCALYGLFFGIAHIAFPPEETAGGRKQALKEVLIIAAVGALAWVAYVSYFAMTGRFRILYITMFEYPKYYTGNMFRNLFHSLRFSQLYPNELKVIAPLIFLTLIGATIAWARKSFRPWAMLTAYVVANQVEIGISGRFYNHYYQLWLPLFSVGAGWATVMVGGIIKEQLPTWLPHAFGAVALLFVLQTELGVFVMNPEQFSVQSYGGFYAASEAVADEINKILAPGETIFVFGDEPGFYFLTNRRPAVGSFFIADMAGGPLAKELTDRAIRDLERQPPDMVIILNNAIGEHTNGPLDARLGPQHPLRMWVSQHYCPVQMNRVAMLTVCAKPGSGIERRPDYQTLIAELNLIKEVR